MGYLLMRHFTNGFLMWGIPAFMFLVLPASGAAHPVMGYLFTGLLLSFYSLMIYGD